MNPPGGIEGQPGLPVGQSVSAKRTNYFVRHWRGQLSLGISYWVNTVLGGCFLVFLGAMIGSAVILSATPLAIICALALIAYALTIVAFVWQYVGIWRSASNHVARGGSGAWATVAKIIVVIGTMRCVVLIYKSYIPQSMEMVGMLTGDARMPSYEIKVLPGGTEIVFRGGLRAGCAKELERVLSATTRAKVLDIESPGGRVSEARRMIRLVREHRLTTYTARYCMSAATLVLMSGKDRVIAPGARIGFHTGRLPGATVAQRLTINLLERATMRSAGVSDRFIERVLATPSNQLWYPTFEEMREAGVVNSQSYIRNGKSEDEPDYIKRLEEWDVRKPLPPDK
jgi:hypothetical protein